MIRRYIAALAIVVVGLFGMQGVAAAEPYEPEPGVITISVSVNIPAIVVNGRVVFSGFNFRFDQTIRIRAIFGTNRAFLGRGLASDAELAASGMAVADYTTTVNADGTFSVELPMNYEGLAVITATGVESGQSSSTTVDVLSAAGVADAAPLPAVGPNLENLATTSTTEAAVPAPTASVVGPIVIGAGVLLGGLSLLFFGTRGVIRRKSGHTTG